MARRSYGTGSLTVREDSNGRETWYGRWRVGDRKLNRRIGPKRQDGSRDGLTRSQAEQEFRRLMESEVRVQRTSERVTIADAGKRYIEHVEGLGRKRSTTGDYKSILRTHLEPFFATKTLSKISAEDVESYMAAKARAGRSTKSIRHDVMLLQAILSLGEKRGWCHDNPCRRIDKPRVEVNPEIRFLDEEELEAVLAVEPEHDFDPMLRVMYLTAAMTGLRLGELRGLRWRDVDWPAGRVRVRQSYVRGELGTPKSRRSSRSVPLADRVAGELDRHYQRSAYKTDDDLVFGNPQTGKPISASIVEVRFKKALEKSEVRRVRFHDLRHSFATRVAAAGVAMRTLQEWLGHRNFATTLIYADYAPSPHEGELVEQAFAHRSIRRSNLSETEVNSEELTPHHNGKRNSAGRAQASC
jgi:integrase